MRNLSIYRRPGSIWDVMSEFEKAFDSTMGERAQRTSTLNFHPAVDVDEEENHYLISVDLPGVKEENIKVDVHLGQLTISGERTYETKKERGENRFYERSFGQFSRSFSLPNEVDAENIQARFENGVLEVFVPKAEKAKAKSIKVEKGGGGLFSRLLGDKKDDKAEH